MFGLLKKQSLLDEATIEWMFDSFAWALGNFDTDIFKTETILVTPSNEHFPGTGDNVHAMAQLILDKVKSYAGLAHWPCLLVNEDEAVTLPPGQLVISSPRRGSKALINQEQIKGESAPQFVIPYRPEVIQDPEVLISHFAHILAHYLGTLAHEPPPGGEENWPHVTELLAVFLGFGLMMANTAYTTKIRSCSSCSGPAIERTNFLSQYDITYALAIFSALKDIAPQSVLPHLKSTLRPFYKKAYKEVMGKTDKLTKLRMK